ncbi:MAG: Rieske (2Fe-2S) protein [Anaerolineales bacterium]|nr:Rieske (2Fe-2S) protein [Anaerolineales bacterium]
MNLFRSKAMPDADGYFTTVPAETVLADQITAVSLNRHKIILTSWDGTLYAFSAECPHASADFSKGWISRYKVTCPDHQYCWDVRNGRILWPDDENYRLKKYPVKVEDGIVMVKID